MIELHLKNATDADLIELEGKRINTITTDGNNSAVSDNGLESLGKVIDLESLDLEWANGITDQGLQHLCNQLSLKYIDLSFCEKLTDNGIDKLRKSIPNLVVER